MAVDREKLFDGIENGAAWDAGVVFNRTNGIPLDKWSIFKTYEDAVSYAASNPVAYPGQFIAVVPENGEPQAYVVLANGGLKVLGSDAKVQADWNQTDNTASDYIKNKPEIPDAEDLVSEEYVDNKTADMLKYTAQTLTDEQKLQAKTNIGVTDSITLTQREYDELLDSGKLISTTYYYIYEEVES